MVVTTGGFRVFMSTILSNQQSPAVLTASTSVSQFLNDCDDISVIVANRDGILVDYNRGATAMFGIGAKYSWRGRSIDEFCPADFAESGRVFLRRVIDNRQALHIEHIFEARQLSTTISPRGSLNPNQGTIVTLAGRAAIHMKDDVESVTAENADIGPLDPLSRRELEILLLLGQGLRITEVSKRLCRSDRTIETHRYSIGDKLGFRNRAEMVQFVTSHGLTPDLLKMRLVSLTRRRSDSIGVRNGHRYGSLQ
jgi:DNA-binding CsgD family transcriptional regulator